MKYRSGHVKTPINILNLQMYNGNEKTKMYALSDIILYLFLTITLNLEKFSRETIACFIT